MDRGSYLVVLFFCVLAIVSSSSLHTSKADVSSTSRRDMQALIAFQGAVDGGGLLKMSWNHSSPNACRWSGITCENNRVMEVSLNGTQLNGTFDENTLSRLTGLRTLDLSNNMVRGQFPSDLSGLNNLTTLDLSHNSLGGHIPPLPSSLVALNLSANAFSGPFPNLSLSGNSLGLLDLSHNNLTDSIPNLSNLTNLTTLDLNDNSFGGQIPPIPSSLTVLDLSNNSLTGPIPPYMADKFSQAFRGNGGLCGKPTSNKCPGSAPAPSNSRSGIKQSPAPVTGSGSSKHSLSTKYVIIIAVVTVALITVITLSIRKHFILKKEMKAAEEGRDKSRDRGSTVSMTSMEKGDRSSKLSFVENSHQGYDLEDLLRASAEMLGKGSFGTAYKAVMESGTMVAVKRLRDAREMGKKEFDQHMEMLGRLRHPNLVPLRAYYYGREEKLLIYDFMPNGSLFSLLHGCRGPGRTALEWHTRLSIAQGVAEGLTYLHQNRESHKIPHGNLKTSNVLMGKNFEVCIADFGLVPLMPPTIAVQRMAGYRAPEYSYAKKISHKADVYSFGVLLLELLTGRQPINDGGVDLPKWVQAMVREEWTGEVFDLELKTYLHGEEAMVTLLQIAMSCVEPKPDQRPEMADVVEQLQDIRTGESVLDTRSFQSHMPEADSYSEDYSKEYPSKGNSTDNSGHGMSPSR